MLSRPFKERVSGRQVQRIGTQTHMNEDSLPQPPNKGTYFDINYIKNYYKIFNKQWFSVVIIIW